MFHNHNSLNITLYLANLRGDKWGHDKINQLKALTIFMKQSLVSKTSATRWFVWKTKAYMVVGHVKQTLFIPQYVVWPTNPHFHWYEYRFSLVFPVVSFINPGMIGYGLCIIYVYWQLSTDYREILLSLPEKKILSTEESKKRFQKHLDSICHTPSTGFDPWKFADQ